MILHALFRYLLRCLSLGPDRNDYASNGPQFELDALRQALLEWIWEGVSMQSTRQNRRPGTTEDKRGNPPSLFHRVSAMLNRAANSRRISRRLILRAFNPINSVSLSGAAPRKIRSISSMAQYSEMSFCERVSWGASPNKGRLQTRCQRGPERCMLNISCSGVGLSIGAVRF